MNPLAAPTQFKFATRFIYSQDHGKAILHLPLLPIQFGSVCGKQQQQELAVQEEEEAAAGSRSL